MSTAAGYLIVNALGSLDNPNGQQSAAAAGHLNQASDELTIDRRALADAHASGLTAVNITLGYTIGDLPPFEHTMHEIEVWNSIVAGNAADLIKVRTAEDLYRARSAGKIGIIYGFQNGVAIGTDLTRVALFRDLGVRVIQLTYNQANHIGDGAMASENRGLTAFGRQVVESLNDSAIMVDLSHSGERTCLEAAAVSAQPVSINHTGCRAVTNLPRNKTDEELRLVASRGGFVGIYFMPFLNSSGHARAADVVEHIDHAVNVCGEDHVGIGTDGSVTSVDDLDAYRATLAEHVALHGGSDRGFLDVRLVLDDSPVDGVPWITVGGLGHRECGVRSRTTTDRPASDADPEIIRGRCREFADGVVLPGVIPVGIRRPAGDGRDGRHVQRDRAEDDRDGPGAGRAVRVRDHNVHL